MPRKTIRSVARTHASQSKRAIIAKVLSRYPDEGGATGHGIDTTDRREVRHYIAAKLRRAAR